MQLTIPLEALTVQAVNEHVHRKIMEAVCNFKRKLSTDVTLQDMVKDLEWTAPLNPKEGF